jgi:repressor LexA
MSQPTTRKSRAERKQQIFRFVRDRLLAGAPPSIREVQQAFQFRAVQSARDYLEALVEDGLLEKQLGKARSYRLPENTDWPTLLVPLLGGVQAGLLTTAIEDPDGFVAVQSRKERSELFALRVRGESMRDAAILPDDIVIVQRQPSADSGDIVVALVEDEATVKRLRLRDGRVELHPENPAFEPIIPDPEQLQILGKVVEVRRFLDPTLGI